MGVLIVPAGFGVLSYNFALVGDPEPMSSTVGVDIAFGASSAQEKVNLKADQFMGQVIASDLGAGWSFTGCTLRDGAGGVFEAPRSRIGSGTESQLPNNCAFLYKKLSALAGRRGRGRMYIPPMFGTETNVNNLGVITEVTRLAIENKLKVAIPGDDMVLLHTQAVGGPAPPPPTPITAFLLDKKVATQRRRLRR